MPDTPEPRDFAAVLIELEKGGAHAELSAGLHDLIQAVIETGKGGTVALTVKVSPVTGTTSQVSMTAAVKVTPPKPERAASLFFLDRAGNPSRNPAEQPSLFDTITTPTPAPAATDTKE